MLTIVYIVNQLRKSGPIHVLKNIVENLDRNSFRPIIVKFMHDDNARSITHEFVEINIEIYEMNLTFWDLELKTLSVARQLDNLLEKLHPNIVHTHGYHPVLVASYLKYICPKIETLHCISTDYYISSKGFLIGNWMDWRYFNALKKIDCCVAISKTVHKYYASRYPNKNTQVIYNGINPKPFVQEIDKSELRRRLNIEENVLIFVVLGTLSKVKDPITIIKAYKQALKYLKTKQKSKLLFLGQGPLQDKCLSMVDENIELKGYVFNAPDYLQAANFSICASHSEGFGLNFIESVMAGTPVLSSTIGPFNEFTDLYSQLKPFQFSPANVTELADKMCKAVDNIQSIDMKSAKVDALVRFSAYKMAESYMDLYFELTTK